MNTNTSHNTRRKIIVLLTLLGFFTAAWMYYFTEVENARTSVLLEMEDLENTRLLETMIGFKSQSLKTFAADYTYWDDMLLFAETCDTVWANENIKASMSTYNTDLAWVFNRDLNNIYFKTADDVDFKDTNSITKEMIIQTTFGSRFFHFFIKTGSGIIEVSGASIHPTSDAERLVEPGGYFVVGRLWNEKLIEEIEILTASKLKMEDIAVSMDKKHIEFHDFISLGFYTLNSWDKKPVGVLSSAKEMQILKTMHEKSEREFAVILSFIIMVLTLTGVTLYYLVNLPLKKISLALREQNSGFIKDLLGKKDEFGNVADLVNEFFIQKEKLLSEIRERTEVEIKIRLSEEELRHSLKEKEVLIKEVHHRVKNNLQVIISLLKLQSDSITDRSTVQHLNTSLNRIRSIAYVHELLYRSHDLSRIDFELYLNKIVQSLRSIYSNESKRIKIEIESKNVFLTVDKAVPCAVIINELISNAMKHAFEGRSEGSIKIRMNTEDGIYRLSVSDDGIGLGTGMNLNASKTLGLYLVSSLSEQLDGELNITNHIGSEFELKFKAED